MKTFMKKNIQGYKGKDHSERAVYAYYQKNSVCIVKNSWETSVNDSARKKGREMKHISQLWKECGEGFRGDMSEYSMRYRKEHPAKFKLNYNCFSHFLKICYDFCKEKEIDPEFFELADFSTYGIMSVRDLVEKGYLKKVSSWEELDKGV